MFLGSQQKMRWEKVQTKTRSGEEMDPSKKLQGRKGGTLGPGKRWGHTCNSVRNGRLVYVFGGYGKDNCQTNDVHIFDPNRLLWIKPMTKGIPPIPRDSHSCTTVGSSLFIFGGTDGQYPLNDLVIFDTATNTWIQPEVQGSGPEAREGHSAALVDSRLFIFGGCGKTEEAEEIYFNDLHILDTKTMTWTSPITSGDAPSPRDSHTCSSWNNKIIIVGGEDASDSYLADVYVLDADTLVWEQLKTTGQQLTPRAGHCTVAIGNELFVFGGFTDDRNLYDDLHVLNLVTNIWAKVPIQGHKPTSRFSVAGDCLDCKRGILVFIGGCNEHLEALDDLYYLLTDIVADNELDEQKHEKLSLRKELKRKRQEHSIYNGSEREKDNHIYEARPFPSFHQPVLQQPTYVRPFAPAGLPVHASAGADNMSVYDFVPAEEKIFEARITDVFHYGYTIESNIDGKPLRGLLFSYKPGFAHAVNAYMNRKMAAEASSPHLTETHKSKVRFAKPAKRTFRREGDEKSQDAIPHKPSEQILHRDQQLQSSSPAIFAKRDENKDSAASQAIALHCSPQLNTGTGYSLSLRSPEVSKDTLYHSYPQLSSKSGYSVSAQHSVASKPITVHSIPQPNSPLGYNVSLKQSAAAQSAASAVDSKPQFETFREHPFSLKSNDVPTSGQSQESTISAQILPTKEGTCINQADSSKTCQEQPCMSQTTSLMSSKDKVSSNESSSLNSSLQQPHGFRTFSTLAVTERKTPSPLPSGLQHNIEEITSSGMTSETVVSKESAPTVQSYTDSVPLSETLDKSNISLSVNQFKD